MKFLKQGLSSKETRSFIDNQRIYSFFKISDIIIFQAEDVGYIVLFLSNDVTAHTTRKVMYHQVRFARDTCLPVSLLKSSEVFRLM